MLQHCFSNDKTCFLASFDLFFVTQEQTEVYPLA